MKESDLHTYQKAAVEHIMEHPHCGLFLEMGLGKTVSTLTAVKHLMYDELDVDSVLVVAPKRVAESVWDAEINKWDHLKGLKVSKIIGDVKKRRKALATKADIYIISRDNIAWLVGLYGGSRLPFDMLVVDELSSFKNHKSQRFRALKGCLPAFRRRVGLTGTPAPNGMLDLWAQVYLLDCGERLGKFITRYREQYFSVGRTNGDVVYDYRIKDDAEREIYDKIGDICMSMQAKDYLQLPGRIDNFIELRMDAKLQQAYNKFEEDKVLELVQQLAQLEGQEEPERIVAANATGLSNKLLQFAQGAVYDADHNVHIVHDLKLEAAKELVEDANGKPVLIAWTFRSDRDRLMEALAKYNPRQLQNNQDIEDWNAGKVQVLLMHPASGGHGLNLQAGGHIVLWYGLTWSLELEQQFNARLDRQGQKETVIINRLVACNTIDQDVVAAIRDKASGQDRLMQAVKARIKKYAKM